MKLVYLPIEQLATHLTKAVAISQLPVHLVFMAKLRASSAMTFKFNSDLLKEERDKATCR
jgi:hypothetical protein